MIRKSFIFFLTFVTCFFAPSIIQGQELISDRIANKVIVNGNTYYLHLVKKGEGFYGIAKRYGVSQKEIHEANPNSIFGLKPGDVLHIPVIGGRNSNSNEIEKSGEFIYHTRQKGQTLYYLSNKYNVAVDDIKKYNVGADGDLLIGTIIKIPTLISESKTVIDKEKINYILHQVKAKETLYGISKKYNNDINTIIKSNQALQNGILAVGSTIRIPVDKSAKYVVDAKKQKELAAMEDDKFIYHKINENETIYSVSKRFHVSQSDLEFSNPDLNPSKLPLGFVIRIPKNKIKIPQVAKINRGDDFKIHSVRRKETIYSISRKHNVKIEDIEQANPTKILSNIKKGMRIKIPTLIYLTRMNEQAKLLIDSIAASEAVVEVDSIEVNSDVYNYYKNRETITVALMLPFDVEATRKMNLIKKVRGEEVIEMQREKPVVSARSRSFVEFYEGALLAVDSLKKQGVNIKLLTFDTAPDTSRVKQILADPQMKTVDMIIGPAYASNLKLVSDFSFQNQIKMIYPLSSVNPYLNSNPYLFQVNTPDTLLYSKYADYIVNQQSDVRIVVLKSAVPNANENKLAAEIKDKLYLKYLPQGIVPDFVEISFSEQNVQGVEALLSHDKLNMVVIPSPDEADVSKIITTLHGVSESTEVKVKLIGFGSWLRFQTINAEEIHDLDTQIITPYVLDHRNEMVRSFTSKYRSWYHTEPFAVSPYFLRSGRNSKYSRYGIWGFDVAYYFINARVIYGNQFEHSLSKYRAKQVQFNFNFKRNADWGGFYNDGLYVIGFSPLLEIYRKPLN